MQIPESSFVLMKPNPVFLRYGAAVALCAAALFARLALSPLLGTAAPLAIFTLATLIAARYLGYGPGCVVIVLGGLLGTFFFLRPYMSLMLTTQDGITQLLLFLLTSVAINWLLETRRAAEARARAQAKLFDSILEAVPQGVIVVGPDGYITFANTAAAGLFGLLPSHMVGRLADDAGWHLRPVGGEGGEGGLSLASVIAGGEAAPATILEAVGLGGRRLRLQVQAASLPDGVVVFSLTDLSGASPLADLPRRPMMDQLSRTDAGVRTDSDASRQVSAPVRVLYLDHTAKLSGGEIALLRLLESLDRSRVTPVVLLAENGPLVPRLQAIGVETHVLPLTRRLREVRKDTLGLGALRYVFVALPLLAYTVQVAAFVRRHHVQLLHTNSLKSDLYGALAGRLAGVPVVWHVRDHIDPTYLPAPAVHVFRFLARRLPAYVIANSQSTRERLFLSADRPSSVIPSGLDLKRSVIHDGLADQELQGHAPPAVEWPTPVRIGIVGRLAPWKGQHIFLTAAARVCMAGYEARFLIIGAPLFGEDDYEAALRRQAETEGLAGRVEFLGFQTDVAGVLRGLDILVHASMTPEPFGQVVIEGMAEGRPVVATNGGGVREIITHGANGLLVPMGDAEALAEALTDLLDDPPAARRLGAAGYHHVRQHFTAAQAARRVEKVYADILAP